MPVVRLDPDSADVDQVMLVQKDGKPFSIGHWPGPHEEGSSIQHTTRAGTKTFYWQRLDTDENGHAVHLYGER